MAFAVLACVLMIANRVPAEAFVPWSWVASSMIIGVFLFTTIVWWRTHPDETEVALAVDERLDLDERLSTALAVGSKDDPFARAAVLDAVAVASDPRTKERTKRLFAVQPPAGWWWSPSLVLVAVIAQWLPQMDLFSRDIVEARDVTPVVRVEVEQHIEDVIAAIDENDELREALREELRGLTPDTPDADRDASAEDVRRTAVKKVTDLNRRLHEIIEGERGKTMEAIESSLKGLELPDRDSAARPLAEALARGDFEKAKRALRELVERAENGEMTEAEQQNLERDLQKLAKQIQQAAAAQEQLKDALRQAGMNEQLANDPQALEQALQNDQNLNEQQKQQVRQQSQAAQQCRNSMQGLGDAMQQMAQGLQQGQPGQSDQQAQQQLGEMEQLQAMLQQAEAASNACQGGAQQIGQGLGMAKQGQQGQGNGDGQQAGMQGQMPGGHANQRGSGRGGRAPIAPTPTNTVLKKVKVETDPTGDVIAKQFFQAEEFERGESRAAVASVMLGTVESYDEAVDDAMIPKLYENVHKHYFGEMKKILDEAAKSTESSSEEP